ncbi:ABC transporter permease [Streptomyces nodosus]|uniref:ABC transporter permease n=1 Tax=Streptomyces nodosus TaxID=40318 RepID=A0A0B5DKF8_9ACTN|nr:ABC transporter permease [Streptomyces nodosus]AJE41655.1 ABC transporter permease [Streptomyces nodosus]MBB4792866.1 putative ABC transport system permease protein [Streptomyces nodosus]QEV40189.1 ABC transporter permease [Streptomyces nodosus]
MSTAALSRPRPARMGPADVLRVGGAGLRSRPMRVFLSALGIAIGIAAMIGVVGISTSSQEELNRRLAALGTNMLTVSPGQTFSGSQARLPQQSVRMVGDIASVESVSAIGRTDAKVYRNDHIPAVATGGISVCAARTDLPATVGATIVDGRWLNAADVRYPATVLGARAAEQLGVFRAGDQVWLGGRWFTVVGILAPDELAPELDSAALVGWPVAENELGYDGYPTTLYTRVEDRAVADVQSVLGATANPENPNEVDVSRPSDALAARQATDDTLGGLLLGLGAVALLVGGVGVANTMVISVLERRAEIGLRRSLGATRGQIRTQFLCESLLLSALGGIGGVALGIAVTAGYAAYQGWPSVVPAWAMAGGVGATLVIGGLAGFYPALRAAKLPPTEALATA